MVPDRCCRRSRRVAKEEQSLTSGPDAGSGNSAEKFGLSGNLLVDERRTGNGVGRRRRQDDVVSAELCQRRRRFLVAPVDDVDLETDGSVLSSTLLKINSWSLELRGPML